MLCKMTGENRHTFTGASTLINFGDSTTYSNYNLFRNLNILKNITTVRG